MSVRNHTDIPGSLGGGVARFEPLVFSDLANWESEDHVAALSCFRVSAKRMVQKPYTTKKMGTDAELLAVAGKAALDLDGNATKQPETAKDFFERWFRPYRIIPVEGQPKSFVTAYFEPEVEASRVRTERFRFPILRRPDDLVALDDSSRPENIPPDFFFARKTDGGLEVFPDRKAIEEGALDEMGLELFWLENRIEIFFIHIQGSARLALRDGSVARISYAGKTGHPFTGIGRLLIERGELNAEDVTMQSIRNWLFDHPDEAEGLMQENRSYIFFQVIDHPNPDLGPVAAAGVPLTPGRSLAIDHRLQTFGVPIWVETKDPFPGRSTPFARLMVAQDTGSAIVGPARGDLFIGTGYDAGQIAGRVKHDATFTVLLPRKQS